MPPTILSATFQGVVEKPENSGQLRARFSEVTKDIKGVIETTQIDLSFMQVRTRLLWHMAMTNPPYSKYDSKMIEEYRKASDTLETKKSENPKHYTLKNRENDGWESDQDDSRWQKRTVKPSKYLQEKFELKEPY
jgi:hypothetical protein